MIVNSACHCRYTYIYWFYWIQPQKFCEQDVDFDVDVDVSVDVDIGVDVDVGVLM